MKKQKPPLIVIVGPTASGKTSLAVALAQKCGGEVISADSRQVYRELNIGTEKVTKREMQGVPHHCLDIASPRRAFSVEQWLRHAQNAVRDIRKHGNIPILAGGTGLYIDAFVYGAQFPTAKPNYTLRHTLEKKSTKELFHTLKTLDPKRAKTIEPKNPRRLIRAIEIAHTLGAVPPPPRRVLQFDVLWIGIMPDMDTLQARITTRLEQSLRKGLVAETKKLRDEMKLSWKRINELGLEYRIVGEYIRKEITKEEMREKLVRAVVRYAKKQQTWLKRYREVQWYTDMHDALRATSCKK